MKDEVIDWLESSLFEQQSSLISYEMTESNPDYDNIQLKNGTMREKMAEGKELTKENITEIEDCIKWIKSFEPGDIWEDVYSDAPDKYWQQKIGDIEKSETYRIEHLKLSVSEAFYGDLQRLNLTKEQFFLQYEYTEEKIVADLLFLTQNESTKCRQYQGLVRAKIKDIMKETLEVEE